MDDISCSLLQWCINSKIRVREVPTLLFFYVYDRLNAQFVSSQIQFYNLELVKVQFVQHPH